MCVGGRFASEFVEMWCERQVVQSHARLDLEYLRAFRVLANAKHVLSPALTASVQHAYVGVSVGVRVIVWWALTHFCCEWFCLVQSRPHRL